MSAIRRLYGADQLFEFPLTTFGATDFFLPAATPVIEVEDVKVTTDVSIRSNPTAKILGYDSGEFRPSPGDVISENGGNTTSVVMFVVPVSGVFASNTSAGFMFVKTVSGDGWSDNDQINNTTTSQSNIATVDAGTTFKYSATQLAATAGLFATNGHKFYVALTASEMACEQGSIRIKDTTGTKLWVDQEILFETEGHYLAKHKTGYEGTIWINSEWTGLAYGTFDNPATTDDIMMAVSAATGIKRAKVIQAINNQGAGFGAFLLDATTHNVSAWKIDLGNTWWFITANAAGTNQIFTVYSNGAIYHATNTNIDYAEYEHIRFVGAKITFTGLEGWVSPQSHCSYGGDLLFSVGLSGASDDRTNVIYYGAFVGNYATGTRPTIKFNDVKQRLQLIGCYGNANVTGMTHAESYLEHTGWGELYLTTASCTAGSIKHTSHVKVMDENGVVWVNGSGKTNVLLISHPNQTDLDLADGGRLDVLIDAIKVVTDAANNIDGKTLQQALRIIAATTAGNIADAGGSTETFIGLDGATTRVSAAVTAAGNRTNTYS